MVRLVKIFLTSDNSISTAYSYIVVGDLIVQDNSYITVQYDYEFLTSATEFAVPSTKGYTMGAPLQLVQLTSSTSEYFKVINPINLAYRK